jgi:hypothetical protein
LDGAWMLSGGGWALLEVKSSCKHMHIHIILLMFNQHVPSCLCVQRLCGQTLPVYLDELDLGGQAVTDNITGTQDELFPVVHLVQDRRKVERVHSPIGHDLGAVNRT